MSQTITISDGLYAWLEAEAKNRGLSNIEKLLERWQSSGDERCYRQETVRQIDELRKRLFVTYGEMPDSVELIRNDRAR